MSTEFKCDKHIYDIGSIIKKVWKIVNCTFLGEMTHLHMLKLLIFLLDIS